MLAFINANVDCPESNAEIEARKKLATKIIHELCKNENLKKIIEQYHNLCKVLINFANIDGISEIPKNDPILKIKNFNLVQCLTLSLPVSSNQDYRNIVSIVKWSDKMSLVGGINAPKKLECLCSDGISRYQLLKAKDDLRQDAVMEQVFSILNGIFGENKETMRQNLNIRTYKILPLSRVSREEITQ